MQKLFEYIFFVLDNCDITVKDEEDKALLEVTSLCKNLSREELKIVLDFFGIYEDYVFGVRRAYHNLSDKVKCFDSELGIREGCSSELTRISNLVTKEGRKLEFLGKVYDIASDRICELASKSRG